MSEHEGDRKPMPSISNERARELLAGPKPSVLRMTAEQTPGIETVLAEHSTVATGLGEWCCKCSPGEWRPTAHRSSHVAQALAPVLAAAVREARAAEVREAAAAAVSDGDDCVPWDQDHDRATVACWLEDRADRTVDAPEGGEGR